MESVSFLELPMTGDYPTCPRCGDEQTLIVLPSIPTDVPPHLVDPRWIEGDLIQGAWLCPACYVKTRGHQHSGWGYNAGLWCEESGTEEVHP